MEGSRGLSASCSEDGALVVHPSPDRRRGHVEAVVPLDRAAPILRTTVITTSSTTTLKMPTYSADTCRPASQPVRDHGRPQDLRNGTAGDTVQEKRNPAAEYLRLRQEIHTGIMSRASPSLPSQLNHLFHVSQNRSFNRNLPDPRALPARKASFYQASVRDQSDTRSMLMVFTLESKV